MGPRPDDAASAQKIGIKKWIDRQLHPERIPENPELERRLADLDTLTLNTADLFEIFQKRKGSARDREAIRPIVRQLQNARILRAVYTERQLEDLLTDFWFNHFNVFLDKGADRVLTGAYERDAIRPHVLGKFRELLGATAEHPAMLFYLDNWQSISPDSMLGRRAVRNKRERGLNENYARELLELHTLGVDGGYTQQDVIEVARCFTGWTIRRGNGDFVPAMHDRGPKSVLGHSIAAGGGKSDGLQVLDILARHPSTARFVSRKLAQRFVSDNPPESLVAAMAATYIKTSGDIRAVMQTLVESKEFWSTQAYQAKLRSPFELAIAAVRAGNPEVQNGLGLAQEIARMGQPLYRKSDPNGYGNTGEEWKNSASLLARMNFAGALAANRIPGVKVSWQADAKEVELKLGSPEFQKR